MSSVRRMEFVLALIALFAATGCGESQPPPGPSETAELTQAAVDPFFQKFRATAFETGPKALQLAEMEARFGKAEKKPEPVASPTGEPMDEYFWTNGVGKLEVGVQDGWVRTMGMTDLQQP